MGSYVWMRRSRSVAGVLIARASCRFHGTSRSERKLVSLMTIDHYPTSVGLFGTYDGSEWWKPFTTDFQTFGIDYYRPDREGANAAMDRRHLETDRLLVIVVTGGAAGLTELEQVTVAVGSVERSADRRLLAYIEKTPSGTLPGDERRQSAARRGQVRRRVELACSGCDRIELVSCLAALWRRTLAIVQELCLGR